MIHFLSSLFHFAHFHSLPVILHSNSSSWRFLLSQILYPFITIPFELLFHLILYWPPLCVLLHIPIPFLINYFIFHVLHFFPALHPSSFYFLHHIWSFCHHLWPFLLLFSLCLGSKYILDATSTVCYATYSKFWNRFSAFVCLCVTVCVRHVLPRPSLLRFLVIDGPYMWCLFVMSFLVLTTAFFIV